MLATLVDIRGYFFWMLVVSVACIMMETVAPWRREQPQLRRQLGQDIFWLIFNGHFAGLLVAAAARHLLVWISPAVEAAERLNLLADSALWLQVLVFFVIKDLLDWCVHNLLHRVPYLWTFHKLHHSIEVMDWIGNFRFHWMEIVVYKALTFFPLLVLGVDGRVVLWIAILTTLIGHLNHSNLNITWGPLRYLLNSPRMHIWHHMYELPTARSAGVNFAISLSLWDWSFATSYWPSSTESPEQQPRRLGFRGMETFPKSLFRRISYPITAQRA